MSALSLLGACDESSESNGEAEQLPLTIDVQRDFGAIPDGITDNEPFIQAALDAAAQRGVVVHLSAGIYGIGRPLVLRSGVHLSGEGKGITVLRSLVRTWGKVADGAEVTAAVAMVGAHDSSVTDLTVDLSAAATESNGVVALPTGSNFEGTPSTACVIADVEVIGGGDYHAYMIWNLRGRDIQIVNNVIDGGLQMPVTGSQQEGIESYGGTDVLVGWNVVRNIGNAALNFGSAGHPDTTIERLTVIGNVVTNSGKGLNIGTAMGVSAPQNVAGARIEENEFSNIWQTAIYVPAEAGTEIRDVSIIRNRIRNVGSAGVSGTGVYFLGSVDTGVVGTTTSSGNAVIENRIDTVHGPNATGVLVIRFPNIRVVGNSIENIAHTGVFATSADHLEVESNWIANTDYFGLFSHGMPSRLHARFNTFWEWDRVGQGFAGVSIHDAAEGEIRGNAFWNQSASGSAVRVEAGSANFIVFGNQLNSEEATAVPFVNNAVPSNLGTVTTAAGQLVAMVSNSLVIPTSTVRVLQTSGAPLGLSVEPASGTFRVVFTTLAQGGETFRYEIDP